MALLGEIFVLSSVWFWVVFILSSGLIIFGIADTDERDKDPGGGLSTVVVIISILILQYIVKTDIFSYVGMHPGEVLLWVGGYTGAGILYSFAKWLLFLINQKDLYQEKKENYLRRLGVEEGALSLDQKNSLRSELSEVSKQPLARQNKQRIIVWMMYWPWSLLWTFISDFMRKLFRHIYTLLHKAYQSVSDRVWKDVDQDYKKYPERERTSRHTEF